MVKGQEVELQDRVALQVLCMCACMVSYKSTMQVNCNTHTPLYSVSLKLEAEHNIQQQYRDG